MSSPRVLRYRCEGVWVPSVWLDPDDPFVCTPFDIFVYVRAKVVG
jgi:hypothetical protein